VKAKDNLGCTPLYNAADGGHFDVVKALIDDRAIFDAKMDLGYMPLALAGLTALGAWFRGFDNYGIVKELIDRRADLNAKNSKRRTPLLKAACNKDLAIIRIFLEKWQILIYEIKKGKHHCI
jgi:ankyrin repeat protein